MSKFFSPLLHRRLAQFKRNKRAFVSFWWLLAVIIICTGAPFLANDKPLIVQYKNDVHFPIFKSYPETFWDGDFATETDYRDPYVVDLINKDGWMLMPLIPYSFDTINMVLDEPAPSAPTTDNVLGTDDQGRDVMARLIYGLRVSLLFSFILTVFSAVIGVAAGAVQGYYGGWIDLGFQRILEIWQGLPALFILIILASVITPGFWPLLGVMILFSWPALVDVVRAEFLRARNFDYVRAAKALGVNDFTIMHRHVLPNAMVATLTMLPFMVTGGITVLTSLDFLGFGLPPGSASLGEMLAQGKNNLYAPWLALTAFMVLAIVLTLLTFVGEGVRDAFDPRKVS